MADEIRNEGVQRDDVQEAPASSQVQESHHYSAPPSLADSDEAENQLVKIQQSSQEDELLARSIYDKAQQIKNEQVPDAKVWTMRVQHPETGAQVTVVRVWVPARSEEAWSKVALDAGLIFESIGVPSKQVEDYENVASTSDVVDMALDRASDLEAA